MHKTVNDSGSFLDVQLFELVSALSFTTNKSLWDPEGTDHLLLLSIRDGSSSIKLDETDLNQNLSKFFVGLFLFSFYIYENIGKRYIVTFKKSNSAVIKVKFFDGDTYIFDVHKFDDPMYRFFKKSLNILFSMDSSEITEEVFLRLSKMYQAASQRLSKEVKFLKDINKIDDIYVRLFDIGLFNINVMAIIFSALPQNYLNSFFMLASNCLPRDFEFLSANGIKIKAKAYFSTDTLDMDELYNKVKVLVSLYQADKELFLDMYFNADIKEYMRLVFTDLTLQDNLKAHIIDTIDGQFIPRLETIRAFRKIIG